MPTKRRQPQHEPVDPAVRLLLQLLQDALALLANVCGKNTRVYKARPTQAAEVNRATTRLRAAVINLDGALEECYREEPPSTRGTR